MLPLPFAVFAFGSVFLMPMMARQSKEVSAAIYAAYPAVMAVAAGVIFMKQNRRGMAVGAALACAAFTGVSVFYAYLAYGAQR
ncbi:MAG: hypothetical protein HYV95_12690 [Opitutae bacterium]|nr:hypothetical protein [Opitutae bacterium]